MIFIILSNNHQTKSFFVPVKLAFKPFFDNLLLSQRKVGFDKLEKLFCFIFSKYFLHFNQNSAFLPDFCWIWFDDFKERFIFNL